MKKAAAVALMTCCTPISCRDERLLLVAEGRVERAAVDAGQALMSAMVVAL